MRSGKKKPEENSVEALEEEEEEEGGGAEEGEAEEEEEENPEEEKTGEEKEEPPKLEEGFYEIEAIRRRRVRKGQLQYLIKWRGWPESANTWEPIDNLQSCSDVIEAYEERLQKSSRKKKRRVGPPYSAFAKNLQEPDSSNDASREVEVKKSEDGDKTRVEGAKGTSKGVNDDEAKREGGGGGGSISIQINGGSKEEGLVEDGSLKGAKKRKSGSVKRFKPEGAGQDDKGEKMGNEDADSGEDDNGEKQKLEEAAKAPYIVKILKAVEFDASVTNNVQQVSLKFKALRSDGQEVIVDDKDLKLNNPLVLINFYEQHLRYSPPTCDVNEQQS